MVTLMLIVTVWLQAFGFMGCVCLICSTWFAFRAKLVEGEIPPEQSRSIAELPGDIPT